MKKEPRILLGTPTFEGKEYCLDLWAKIVKEISQKTKSDILLVDNSKNDYYANLIRKKYKLKVIKSKHYEKMPLTSLGEARKKFYQYAIDNKYDFIFSLEQDIFPPKDIIQKLLSIRNNIKVKEAIIGVPYIIKKITFEKRPFLDKDSLTNTALERMYSKTLKRMIQKNLTNREMKRRKKIFRAYACGLGCTLIDVSIIKKFKVRYTEKRWRPDDAFLFLDCFNNKIPVYVDPSLLGKVIHIEGSNLSMKSWGAEK
jgi:GT2 family glycosyltransferase